MSRKLPQTKSELDQVLIQIWASPKQMDEAYHLYALGDDKGLAKLLNWILSGGEGQKPKPTPKQDEPDTEPDDPIGCPWLEKDCDSPDDANWD